MLSSTEGRRFLGALSVAALLAGVVAVAQIPDKFTNLKVVPQDIDKKELVDTMKAFTFALGTRCWYCHEGEGDDLSTYDFAADGKPTKDAARRHLKMTNQINREFFAGKPAVNCMTCHQGDPKPAN